ncbi:DMT family transporter [Streptomyces sp. TS71-3]|uniref:DMT family transporter n=1 Tax=Streptomyces sp. TS71-3 TaxID=2733862 RepID=UPI001B014CE3|nr:DMT family transporter [Streptomyces sp. TS71-3]GHJ37024.1 hypothetical protein Sm713_26330 [Streptomyces sp. TS71-3]
MLVLSVLFALAAAGSNALGTVLQRRAVLAVPSSNTLRVGLLRDLSHTPIWFAGMLGVVASAALQAVALATGPLAVVQPVFVLELPLALVIGGLVFHVRRTRRSWTAVGCIVLGLAVCLGSLAPSGGHEQVPGLSWPPVLIAAGTLGTVLTVIGTRLPVGPARAASLAAAAAIGNALAAALIKSSVAILAHDGITGFLLAWQTYGFAVVGGVALLILETAMQGGPLIASQPALTLGDAAVSVCLGVVLYGEHPHTGLRLIPAVLGAALLLYGTFVLSHTRCLADCRGRGDEQAAVRRDPGRQHIGASPAA